MAPKKQPLADQLLSLFGIEPGGGHTQRLATSGGFLGNVVSGYLGSLYNNTQLRDTRYRDYDSMDCYSDIHIALDVFAEEAAQEDEETQKRVSITVNNQGEYKDVQEILDDLLERIAIDDRMWGWARHLAKYGDMFVYPIIEADEGIVDVQHFHPINIAYVPAPEDPSTVTGFKYNNMLPTFDTSNQANPMPIPPKGAGGRVDFDIWEFIHFKILGSDMTNQYGHSMIEAARQCWKQLEMLETSMAIYRLYRAGARTIYYIDVGTATGDEALEIINAYKRSLKSSTYMKIDQNGQESNGGFAEFLSKFNPLTAIEDIYWPVTGDKSLSKVDQLVSDVSVTGISDVEHFRNKLRAALGIPKAYFDQDISGWNANRALAQQDIRFAKKIERLQQGLVSGIDMLCRVHLVLKGYRAEDIDFTVNLTPASNLLELQRLEVMTQRQQIATNAMGMAGTFGFDGAKYAEFVLKTIMGYDTAFIRKFRDKDTDPTVTPLEPAFPAIDIGPGEDTRAGASGGGGLKQPGLPKSSKSDKAIPETRQTTYRRTLSNERILESLRSRVVRSLEE